MKDSSEKILYVGKAINLKKRVASYFNSSSDGRFQIRFLMERVEAIDWIVTDTEKEALILENNLIKEHRPRYNLSLRDDKTYFSLRLDPAEEFPRLTIIRKVIKDGARYFGPYSSATAAREVLKELYHLFPLRHYPLANCRRKSRPCLYYQLKQCSAPCAGKISKEGYDAIVEGATLFLSGRRSDIARVYREKMVAAAKSEEYEEAARYRDLLASIEKTVERQKTADATGGDCDVVGYLSQGEYLQISLLFVRNGLLLGSRSYLPKWEFEPDEGVEAFLAEYYSGDVIIPDEILLPLPIPSAQALAEVLSEKRGKKVTINVPQRGRKLEMVKLAQKNAESAALERQRRAQENGSILDELKERLNLSRLPVRIECYDISNIQGSSAVGSRVSFYDCKPEKSAYRRYRIKGIEQSDDFGMMREILSRRFTESDKAAWPDLIIVDGGMGQLGILVGVIAELGIEGVELAGLAKSRVTADVRGERVERSDERVFLPGRKNPVVLRQNSPALLLLARIRDEAHRFAITYHRKLRSEKTLVSALDSISGIGETLRNRLLQQFGSIQGIREAPVGALAGVKGVTRELAERIAIELGSSGGMDENRTG